MKPFPAKVRKLAESERRLLHHHHGQLKRQLDAQRKRGLTIFCATWSVLATLTIMGGSARWWIVISFWLITGFAICIPSLAMEKRSSSKRLRTYDFAIEADVCREYAFDVRRNWEIEAADDEGPVYEFELSTGEVAIIGGQDFDADQRFPCSAFALIEICDAQDNVLLSEVKKAGIKIPAERILPASARNNLKIPKTLTLSDGPLEQTFEEIKAA